MLNKLAALQIDDGTALLFAGILLVVAIVAILLLIRGVRRDRNRFLMRNVKNKDLTSEIFDKILMEKTERAKKNTHFSFVVIEILYKDNFVNMYGEEQYVDAIDKILDRIEQICPTESKICKHSLDRLAILINEDLSVKELNNLCSMMTYEAKRLLVLSANLRVEMQSDIGAVQYNEFSRTYQQLWENASIALSSAKAVGANQYSVFSSELSDKDSDEFKFYQEIKQAIADKEFEMYYQPIVQFSDDRVYGYESLLRWNHKTLGVLSPSKFLRIMEQSGDINWVGVWAFEELVKLSNSWKAKYPSNRYVLTMNLSQKQLLNTNLVEEMRRIIRKYHAEPKDFCFEVVEFAMFEKSEVIRSNISKLHQAGFLIAIDNYGLEMSNLGMLDQTDIDMIKLDRDFLDKAKENFVLSSIVTMLKKYAEKVNAVIVAEGIEKQAELALVRSFDITYGQGYFFSQPMPVDKIVLGSEKITPAGDYVAPIVVDETAKKDDDKQPKANGAVQQSKPNKAVKGRIEQPTKSVEVATKQEETKQPEIPQHNANQTGEEVEPKFLTKNAEDATAQATKSDETQTVNSKVEVQQDKQPTPSEQLDGAKKTQKRKPSTKKQSAKPATATEQPQQEETTEGEGEFDEKF